MQYSVVLFLLPTYESINISSVNYVKILFLGSNFFYYINFRTLLNNSKNLILKIFTILNVVFILPIVFFQYFRFETFGSTVLENIENYWKIL